MVFFFAGTIAAAKFKPLRDRFLPNDQIAITVLLGIFALSFSLSLYTSLGLQKLIWIFLSLPALVIAVTAIDDKLSQIKERPFLWLGLMSFSIYIWHFPVQAVMHYWINGAQIDSAPAYNSPILFWLYLVSIVAIAHLSLVSIEKWGSSCIRSFEKSWTDSCEPWATETMHIGSYEPTTVIHLTQRASILESKRTARHPKLLAQHPSRVFSLRELNCAPLLPTFLRHVSPSFVNVIPIRAFTISKILNLFRRRVIRYSTL